MRVLLDTHVLLWAATAPARLGPAREVLSDPATELVLSAASTWEIVIKHGTGRLSLPEQPEPWLRTCRRRLGLEPLPVTWEDTTAVAELPRLHRDPFDRVLVAQARRHDLVLATADALVRQYDVPLLDIG